VGDRAPGIGRHVILAGIGGNLMEWFDFAIYGFFAPVIGTTFFPASDPVSSLLAAFGVFASGFLARPLGAAFFGHLGDRYGRTLVLRRSIQLMGAATFLMGVLPTYAMAGVAAPVALTVLRVLQGFSTGGEYTGSAIYLVERAPEGTRGAAGSWTAFGAVAGVLLGSAVGALVSALCSDAALHAWGWRVPFLLGVLIAGGAAAFRRDIDESASFPPGARSPALEAIRYDRRVMLRVSGIVLGTIVAFYMMFIYVTTYLTVRVGVASATALEIDTLAMCALLLMVPLGGWLSDRTGRKPVLLGASIGSVVLAVPLLGAMHHDDPSVILAGQLGFAVLVGLATGANIATMVEITPPERRCSTISIGYNLTLALFGGTTPLVATWLIRDTGNDLMPAYYVMALAAITTAVLWTLPETAHGALAVPAEGGRGRVESSGP
jgi:MFS transporter, MHS family, proline/betaine transporter